MNVSVPLCLRPKRLLKLSEDQADNARFGTRRATSDDSQKATGAVPGRDETSSTTIPSFPGRGGIDSVKLPLIRQLVLIPRRPLLLSMAKPAESVISMSLITLVTPSREQQRQTIDDQWQPEPVQKTGTKKWLNFAIRLGFTLLLFAFLFRSMSWSAVLVALRHIHHGAVLIGLGVGSFGIVVSAYQWRSLLTGERIHLDLGRLINLYIVGIALSHFLPTGMGGDAAKAFYVGRESGNSASAASAVVMSRVTGFFSMLFVAFTALIIWHAYFAQGVVTLLVLLSLTVAALIAGAIFSVTLLPQLFKRTWTKHRLFTPVTRFGDVLSISARRPASLSIAILFGILFHIVACLNYYSYASALGMHVPLHFYFVAIPLVSLIAFLPISINGFGVRESAFVYIFSTIHVASATALLLALLIDTQVLFFGIVGGCIYFTLDSRVKAKKLQ